MTVNNESIVIKSPGGPVVPIKMRQIADFNAPSLSRNPKIMYVFDVMGLAEQRGFGFKTVREMPSKSQIPLPLVSFDEPYIVFTLPLSMKAAEATYGDLSPNEIKVLEFIRLNGDVSSLDVQKHMNIEQRQAARILEKLMTKHYVASTGRARSTRYIAVESRQESRQDV